MQTKDQSTRTRTSPRQSSEGNAIWREYRNLTLEQASQFRALLMEKGLNFGTFQKQSLIERSLGSIRTRDFELYRGYFLQTTGADIVEDFWNEQTDLPRTPLPQLVRAMLHDFALLLAAVAALLSTLRGRWLYQRGYRAGFRKRGLDARAELREEYQHGYNLGRFDERYQHKTIRPHPL